MLIFINQAIANFDQSNDVQLSNGKKSCNRLIFVSNDPMKE